MKKLFLLAVSALVGFSADAQQAPPLHISGQACTRGVQC